jgi:hypothetical protein
MNTGSLVASTLAPVSAPTKRCQPGTYFATMTKTCEQQFTYRHLNQCGDYPNACCNIEQCKDFVNATCKEHYQDAQKIKVYWGTQAPDPFLGV